MRCKDGFCGADDCTHCHPTLDDWEQKQAASLARWEESRDDEEPECPTLS